MGNTTSKPKQDWSPGQTVKVGFLSLKVVAKIATPGDGMPDAYVLASSKGFYEFVPHNGLTSINADQAEKLIAAQKRQAARIAAAETQASSQRAAHQLAVSKLLAA